ncbi:MAG: sodium:proton antiporter, partial [Candidatus Rokuibacteriota bacterium]
MAPGEPLPLYSLLPFAATLLAIAVCPLWIPAWWEHNRNKFAVSVALGLPVAAFYVVRE